MYHYVNAITNDKGDALKGYFVRAVDTTTDDAVDIFADSSSTAISSVSGVANAAKVDDDGNVSFWVASGDYHVDIYSTDATTFIRRITNVPMVDAGALQLDYAADTGATLIGTDGGDTLQVKLDALDDADTARPTSASLIADTGSTLIMHKSAGTGTFARTLRQWGVVGGLDDANVFNWIDSDLDPDLLDGSNTTDLATMIGNAATARAAQLLRFPAATYLIADKIAPATGTKLLGVGKKSLIICGTTLANLSSNGGQRLIDLRDVTDIVIDGFALDNSAITTFGNGTRNIYATGSSRFLVRNCYGTTPGAFIACVGCDNYRILDNDITFSATDDASHNDGVIDNWGGSNNAIIRGNTIDLDSINKYGILFTGEDTDGTANACHDFLIDGNTVKNSKNVAIWSSGRSGVNHDFQIVNNRIDTVTDFFGVEVTDSQRFAVTGNIIHTTEFNAIRVGLEASEGTFSCTDGVVANNVIEDANENVSTSDLSGSAIGIADASARIAVGPNTVKGSNHRYAVFFQSTTSNCELTSTAGLQAGTQGVVLNGSTSNIVPGGSSYTPTLTSVANVASSTATVTHYERRGNEVHVRGFVSVTPTAGSSTQTIIGISLPIASNLASASVDLSGVASTGFGVIGTVTGDTTNDRAQLQFPASNTSAHNFNFAFSYTVK